MKVALFIDAANFSHITRRLNMRVDYAKFFNYFNNRNNTVVYAGFYTGVEEQEDGNQPLRRLLDWLEDHRYHVVSKPTKSYRQADGTAKIKGNMDSELVTDMLEMCHHVDRIVLVSGDGDFAYPVRHIVKKGCLVTIVASRRGDMLSSELRVAASDMIDLADMQMAICQEPA